ncbi:MAG TPA: BACON domain-containing carbohydrate-binding protein, partial [Vicinamibacterales bacterium]|nr:BACON domain-containing carbohydrate-binding protein [Vicinamibacterales bacterium]
MAVSSRATWIPALLIAVLFLPFTAGAQTTVSNPRIVEFDPSPDHGGVLSDGRPTVQGYELRVYQAGASQPFHRVNMGKPAVQSDGKLRYDFSSGLSAWPAPGGTYEARVAAVGPGGEGVSPLSNRFTLSTCGYTLSGSSALFPAAGGGGAVGVTTTTGCAWTLTESASWIAPMTAGGTGSGTATYSVAANTTSGSRTATLTIAGRPYSVTQEAGASSCSYSTSPSSVSLAAAGGTPSIGVTCSSGCAWTAASSASWVAVSPASGTASGTVRLTVAANTSTTARSATVTIAGRSHSVLQSGATSTTPPPAGALPSPWTNGDIGSVGLSGSASYSSGLFTVVGAGADIWGGADSFHFVRQTMAGDGDVVARVRGVQNTHVYAKGGIMLRASLTANSPHVILDVKPNGGVEFMTRTTAGGATSVIGTSSQAFPAWIRLARRGSTITASVSADGATWRTVGSRSLSLPSTVYAGMAVTSHVTSTRNTSTFDQVSVAAASSGDAPALPSPWQARDIGSVGVAGSTSYSSGVFSVNGAGADIWGTADSFRYLYRPQLAGGEIVARVTAVTNTDPYAKAGVMLRDGVAANARHVTLSLKPGGGIEFLVRSATGGTTQYLGGASAQVPTWLRLQRSSSTVTASYSTDGTTWRTVGTTTITT